MACWVKMTTIPLTVFLQKTFNYKLSHGLVLTARKYYYYYTWFRSEIFRLSFSTLSMICTIYPTIKTRDGINIETYLVYYLLASKIILSSDTILQMSRFEFFFDFKITFANNFPISGFYYENTFRTLIFPKIIRFNFLEPSNTLSLFLADSVILITHKFSFININILLSE